jgi:hypothetical protein
MRKESTKTKQVAPLYKDLIYSREMLGQNIEHNTTNYGSGFSGVL